MSDSQFGKAVRRLLPKVKRVKRGPKGRRQNVYEGLALRSDEPTSPVSQVS